MSLLFTERKAQRCKIRIMHKYRPLNNVVFPTYQDINSTEG